MKPRDPIKHGSLYVDPSEAGFGNHRYIFHFGAYGDLHLLVWGNHLEDALETAAGWLADFAPGHLTDLSEEYAAELISVREETGCKCSQEDPCDTCREAAQEAAEADMTYTESGWLTSWEWGFTEDPDRETILELQKRHLSQCVHVRRLPYGPYSYDLRFVSALDKHRARRFVRKQLCRAGEDMRTTLVEID